MGEKEVLAYDGRKAAVRDPAFRYPADYIGLTRGFKPGYHGGADMGWNAAHGGRNAALFAPGGTNIVRVVRDDGGWNGGYGNYLTMESDGFLVLFGHCMRGSFSVKPGDILPRGAAVCRMNNSGNSSGDHLHYEIYLPGRTAAKDRIDPLPLTRVYPGQTVSERTACKQEILFFEPREDGEARIEVAAKNLRARREPGPDGEIAGILAPGSYPVLERRDQRDRPGGYLWCRIGERLWCAYDGAWASMAPESGKEGEAGSGTLSLIDGMERLLAELRKQEEERGRRR